MLWPDFKHGEWGVAPGAGVLSRQELLLSSLCGCRCSWCRGLSGSLFHQFQVKHSVWDEEERR